MPKTVPRSVPIATWSHVFTVQGGQSESMGKLWLDDVLHSLSKPTLKLDSLEEPLRKLVLNFAEHTGQRDLLEGKSLGRLVAQALLEVWEQHGKPESLPGETPDSQAQRWLPSLIPVIQYLCPALQPERPLKRGDVVRKLVDPAELEKMVEDRALAEAIARKAGRLIDHYHGKVVSSTYNRWRRAGIESLQTAVERAVSAPLGISSGVGTPPSLPDYHVPRREIQRAKALVLRAREKGAWVAIIGIAGIGKTTLLAALAHDAELQEAFPDGIWWFQPRLGTSPLELAHQVAQSLMEPLPLWAGTVEKARAALRSALEGQSVLVLVDNVVKSEVMAALRELGPSVVVVFTTRDEKIVTALDVLPEWQIHLKGLTEEEARQLARRICNPRKGEEWAAWAVLRLLDCHPLAVRIAAGLAAKRGWQAVFEEINDARARLRVLRFPEALNVWASLEADWAEMDASLQHCLEALGRLPFLSWYDVETGMAAWRMSKGEANAIWSELAALQLADPVDETSGRCRLHWLVWDFARQKAERWGWRERLRLSLWEWRYPGAVGSRWWWFSIPKPKDAPSWPWWKFSFPGTKDWWKFAFTRVWLKRWAWRAGQERLCLAAGPEEWVGTTRAEHRCLLSLLLGFSLITAITISPLVFPSLWIKFWGKQIRRICLLAILLPAWWSIVAAGDLRRIVWWRSTGRSFTEARKGYARRDTIGGSSLRQPRAS